MTKPRSRDLSRALAAPRVDLESAYAALVDLAVDPLADAELRCALASMDLQDALDDLAALGVDPGRLVYKVLGVGGNSTSTHQIRAVVVVLDTVVAMASAAVASPEARAGELLALARVIQAVSSARHRLAVASCDS